MLDEDKLSQKLDKAAIAGTAIEVRGPGAQPVNMVEAMEVAKVIAKAGCSLPAHLSGNQGDCMAIYLMAARFGFDPYLLGRQSYTMPRKNAEEPPILAFDSMAIRAIVQAHAPITDGHIDYSYEGEGDERVCIARATLKGSGRVIEHKSPKLGDIKKARGFNEKGYFRGSPLWISKPDQQLAYDTGRDFARKHFPALMLGIFDVDEEPLPEPKVISPEKPKPTVGQRLAGVHGGEAGFSVNHVERETGGRALEYQPQEAVNVAPSDPQPQPVQVTAAPEFPDMPANLDRRKKASRKPREPDPAPAATEAAPEPETAQAALPAPAAAVPMEKMRDNWIRAVEESRDPASLDVVKEEIYNDPDFKSAPHDVRRAVMFAVADRYLSLDETP